MRICIVRVDGSEPEYKEVDGKLADFRAGIGGGWIEVVRTRIEIAPMVQLVMVVDEEGLVKQLPINLRVIAYYPGPIAGDVVFVGEGRDSDGEVDFMTLPADYKVAL